MNDKETIQRAEDNAWSFREYLTTQHGLAYPFYHFVIAEGALMLI